MLQSWLLLELCAVLLLSGRDLLDGLNKLLLQKQLLELSVLMLGHQDITPTDEFSFDIELGDRRPRATCGVRKVQDWDQVKLTKTPWLHLWFPRPQGHWHDGRIRSLKQLNTRKANRTTLHIKNRDNCTRESALYGWISIEFFNKLPEGNWACPSWISIWDLSGWPIWGY